MGELKPPAFYDQTFRTSPNYRGPWEQSTFAPLWRRVAALVYAAGYQYPRVVDLGCGNGAFAEALEAQPRRSPSHYLGIDWSRVAIEEARYRLHGSPRYEFLCEDLENRCDWARGAEVVVACEVLEHLEEDPIWCVVPPESTALWVISLPTKDSEAHLRHFPEAEQAHEWLEQWFKIASYEFTPTGHHLFTARVK